MITPLFTAALEAILHALDAPSAIDWRVYVSLLEVANICQGPDGSKAVHSKNKIRWAVEIGWIIQLSRDGPFTFQTLAEVLDTAETYALENLASDAAGRYLRKMGSEPQPPTPANTVPRFHDHPWLKASHRIRILSGGWSQEQAWNHFAATPPAFPPSHKCQRKIHATTCVKAWDDSWRQAGTSESVLKISSSDMTGRLAEFEKQLEPVLSSGCISEVFNLKDVVKCLTTGPSHFRMPVCECVVESFGNCLMYITGKQNWWYLFIL
ncbi:hypothetical protein C8R47DRAFT_1076663 [Mycena vitilis]|nr:hypothetical protein C8R47DRAFT_1076663 [Mycena vitilis]